MIMMATAIAVVEPYSNNDSKITYILWYIIYTR